LEAAVVQRLAANGGDDDTVPRSDYEAVRRDVDALKRECDQLRTELQTADAAQAKLREAGKSMVDELDQAIGRIDGMIGS
jgi:hypothetical protein